LLGGEKSPSKIVLVLVVVLVLVLGLYLPKTTEDDDEDEHLSSNVLQRGTTNSLENTFLNCGGAVPAATPNGLSPGQIGARSAPHFHRS